jgi:hypothetical protein
MDDITRFYNFCFICIPIRICIGIIATLLSYHEIDLSFYILGTYATITASGFAINIVRALTGSKTKGGLGGDIWWTKARFLHFLNWTICAVLSFLRLKWSGIPLLVDAVFGIFFGILHFKFNIDF